MAPGVKRSAVAAPDGGWGWMIVAGCFITTICTRAITRCISIFFVEFHMHFSSEYSRTAWIHSLVDCTTMLCAPLGSYIGNRLSCRVAVMVGGLLSSVGLVLSSFASSLEYLYLSLGILTGVGFALCYTPAVAMVGTYFSERKALAYGIAMSGSGIGTFVLAPVVQLLIEHYSWRGALLILGGVVSHLCVCGALMKPLGSHSEKQGGKDREEELSMLSAKLAGAKLHMELNLENLEMAMLDGSAVHIDRVSNEELAEEITQNQEQEQAQCLLRNTEQVDLAEITDSNQADGKPMASNQGDEKICGEHSKEEPVVTDTGLKENLKNTDSNPGDTKVILANATSKDFKQDTNSKHTNLKDPTASDQRSQLGATLSATVPAESMRSELELNDLKLPESMLVHSALNDSMQAESKLAESKLAESKLLCEMALCKHPGFPIKNKAPGERKIKEGCFFLPATQEYSFLLIPDFLLLSVSFLFLAFGCSVPFVYLVPYSLSIGVSHQQAALLMSVLGVMGIVGNITFGWISDRKCLRAYRTVSYLLAVGLEGLGCLFVPLLKTFSLLVPFSLFYGYFDGAYVALLPVVTSDTVGPTHLSSALGVVYFLHAVPYLISPPIAGWLVDQTGSYTAAFLLCGFSLICSALILATVTLARRCSRGSSHSYLG